MVIYREPDKKHSLNCNSNHINFILFEISPKIKSGKFNVAFSRSVTDSQIQSSNGKTINTYFSDTE